MPSFTSSLVALSLAASAVAHQTIWSRSMYGVGWKALGANEDFEFDDGDPFAPLGPEWQQDDWWFRGPGARALPPVAGEVSELVAGGSITFEIACHVAWTSFGVSPTVPGSLLDSCPGNPGAYHSGDPAATDIDPSLLSGCALGIADVDNIEDVTIDNLAIFSVNHECVKQKVTTFEIPERMPPCTGDKCICGWFWLANNGTGNFYMTAFDCNVVGSPIDATPIMAPVDPNWCSREDWAAGTCTENTGAKRPLYSYNYPTNVVWQGNWDRPGYHARWGFKNDGAQNDIFEAPVVNTTTSVSSIISATSTSVASSSTVSVQPTPSVQPVTSAPVSTTISTTVPPTTTSVVPTTSKTTITVVAPTTSSSSLAISSSSSSSASVPASSSSSSSATTTISLKPSTSSTSFTTVKTSSSKAYAASSTGNVAAGAGPASSSSSVAPSSSSTSSVAPLSTSTSSAAPTTTQAPSKSSSSTSKSSSASPMVWSLVVTTTPAPTTTSAQTTTSKTSTAAPTTAAAASATPVNLALGGAVQASTENTSSGQTAAKAIDGHLGGYPKSSAWEWATLSQKAGAWIKLSWDSAPTFNQIALYDRPNLSDQILAGTLTFADGSSVAVGPLNNDGSATYIDLPSVTSGSIVFTVTKVSSTTTNVGLSEFQVYLSDASKFTSIVSPTASSTPAFSWSLYNPKRVKPTTTTTPAKKAAATTTIGVKAAATQAGAQSATAQAWTLVPTGTLSTRRSISERLSAFKRNIAARQRHARDFTSELNADELFE